MSIPPDIIQASTKAPEIKEDRTAATTKKTPAKQSTSADGAIWGSVIFILIIIGIMAGVLFWRHRQAQAKDGVEPGEQNILINA